MSCNIAIDQQATSPDKVVLEAKIKDAKCSNPCPNVKINMDPIFFTPFLI